MFGRFTALAAITAVLALTGCVRLIPAGSATSTAPLLRNNDGSYGAPPQPVWAGGAATPNAVEVRQGYYTVQSGDTLRGIGNRTGAGSEAIARANELTEPWTVYAGQRLLIPGGRYHSVGAGETGIAIAQAYGVRWTDMVAENGLQQPYVLRIGQRLRLPFTAPDADAAMRSRAAAFDIGIADIASGSQPAIAEGARPVEPVASNTRAGVPLSSAVAVPSSFGGTFAWPLSGLILESFGSVSEGRRNEGIDISAPSGAGVQAAAPGTVVYSGQGVGVVGGLVLVDHGGGWVTAYGRLGSMSVVRGDSVTKGQRLGAVGDTGYGKGPSLHFEIRRDLKPVDPLAHLPQR